MSIGENLKACRNKAGLSQKRKGLLAIIYLKSVLTPYDNKKEISIHLAFYYS